jgi:hypothetical protein
MCGLLSRWPQLIEVKVVVVRSRILTMPISPMCSALYFYDNNLGIKL